MKHEEIKEKILEYMVEGEGYIPSEIGFYVFGQYKFNDGSLKIPYSPQAHSMMIGKHLKKMKDEKLLYLVNHEKAQKLLWHKKQQ